MKIRDLEMPAKTQLDNLNMFLVDFYNKNVMLNDKLKQYYEIYYRFKEKFIEMYPGKKYFTILKK